MRSRLFYAPLVLLLAFPAFAQRAEEHHEEHEQNVPRANQGRIPPAPPKREDPHAKPEPQRHENGRVNNTQHVDKDHWYGHDSPNDKRYHFDHPFEHGHFEHFGPTYRYRVERIDVAHHRFWFPGGFFFDVAAWDWAVCADWCWNCGDDFVVYEDSDHIGWYLLYNIHTGQYIHVTYMGT